MKHKVLMLVVVILLAMTGFASIAQTTNDPLTNDDANACHEGGTLAGTCATTDIDHDGDVDQDDQDWMWRCGWYLIRVDAGIFSEDILDNICLEIPVVIIEEVEVEKKKKKKSDPCSELRVICEEPD